MNLRLTHNPKMPYMFHLKSLAAYICTGVSFIVITILVLYFFVTRLCKSSRANKQE